MERSQRDRLCFLYFYFSFLGLYCGVSAAPSYIDTEFLQPSASLFTFQNQPIKADWVPLSSVTSVDQVVSIPSAVLPPSHDHFLLLSTNALFLFDTDTQKVSRVDNSINLIVTPGMSIAVAPSSSPSPFFIVAGPHGIYRCSISLTTPCSFTSSPSHFGTVNGIAFDPTDGNDLWIGAENGLFYVSFYTPTHAEILKELNDTITAVATSNTDGTIYAGTMNVLWRFNGVTWHYFRTPGIIDAGITALEFDGMGTLWVGNSVCINLLHANQTFERIGGLQGLVTSNITSLARSKTSSRGMYAGTLQGAMSYDPAYPQTHVGLSSWKYWYGARWLPGQYFDSSQSVVSVASGRNRAGNEMAMFVTTGGLSFVQWQPWTLAKKAEHFQGIVNPRHNRYGLVADCGLKYFGNVSSYELRSSDNDGLWTSMYVASQCFRYALSNRNATIKEQAWSHFEALEFLNNVTGIKGLMARSVLPASANPPSGVWHNSTVYPGWMWKGDTSSDEVDGHLFVYPLVYDLLAETPNEKQRAYNLIYDITHYIVQNGFYLIDITGKPTTWGRWAPAYLNDNATWYDERGLNSMQILAWLLSAYRVSGDSYFLDAYQSLVNTYGYATNVINLKITQPSDDNYSDDELTFLPYFLYLWTGNPLMREEFDLSLKRTIDIAWSEKATLWNFIYGVAKPTSYDVNSSIWTLKNWPLSFINWPTNNTARMDITLNPDLGRKGLHQSVQLLPWDERTFLRWNANPFDLADGNGYSETDPTAYLLPYWMGRYYGFISPPHYQEETHPLSGA